MTASKIQSLAAEYKRLERSKPNSSAAKSIAFDLLNVAGYIPVKRAVQALRIARKLVRK
jgi:hypothetical protein